MEQVRVQARVFGVSAVATFEFEATENESVNVSVSVPVLLASSPAIEISVQEAERLQAHLDRAIDMATKGGADDGQD